MTYKIFRSAPAAVLGGVSMVFLSAILTAQTQPTTTAAPTSGPRSRPATTSRPQTELEKNASANYDKLITAYMKSNFETVNETLKIFSVNLAQSDALTVEKRVNIEWIRRIMPELRPKWWEKTKSDSNTTFQSTIWGKSITTNFMPDDQLGSEMPVDIVNGKLVTVVSWRPTQVDNPRAADGTLSKRLGLVKGDLGEVVVWHELGHNFITASLSAEQAMDLYENHLQLFGTLQEFFADMTALAHCSAHARPVTLLLRLDSLDPAPPAKYRELEPHTRGSHAIGAMFLNEVLADPAKWPNVHLPGTVPADNVELAVIAYVYENWSTDWSFNEDRQLHDWAQKIVRTQGDAIFRSKGKVPLRDTLSFSLMEAQDREFQVKRDAWIKEKLQKAIDSGRADKPVTTPRARFFPGTRMEVPHY